MAETRTSTAATTAPPATTGTGTPREPPCTGGGGRQPGCGGHPGPGTEPTATGPATIVGFVGPAPGPAGFGGAGTAEVSTDASEVAMTGGSQEADCLVSPA